MLKLLGGTIGIIFLIGLAVVVGLLMLIFEGVLAAQFS